MTAGRFGGAAAALLFFLLVRVSVATAAVPTPATRALMIAKPGLKGMVQGERLTALYGVPLSASTPGSMSKARADTEPGTPDRLMNISEVLSGLGAFSGGSYPFAIDPAPCGP